MARHADRHAANRNDAPVWLPTTRWRSPAAGRLNALLRGVVARPAAAGCNHSLATPGGNTRGACGSVPHRQTVRPGWTHEDEDLAGASRASRGHIDHSPGPQTPRSIPVQQRNPGLRRTKWIGTRRTRPGSWGPACSHFRDESALAGLNNGGIRARWSWTGASCSIAVGCWGSVSACSLCGQHVGDVRRGSARGVVPGVSYPDGRTGTSYDVAPDGQRFIAIGVDAPSRANNLRIVQRWAALLPR